MAEETWFNKIKERVISFFRDDDPDIIDTPPDEDNKYKLITYIKENFKSKKENKKEESITNRIYLKRDMAIQIANTDKCLKKSMYNEAINKGYNYGIIELYDFYTTLVKYNNKLYWYVKVLNGKYGLKDGEKYKKGYFNEYTNIRCLINAINGKYIYINENFNTKDIRMIDDEEYLEILFKFKNN